MPLEKQLPLISTRNAALLSVSPSLLILDLVMPLTTCCLRLYLYLDIDQTKRVIMFSHPHQQCWQVTASSCLPFLTIHRTTKIFLFVYNAVRRNSCPPC